MLNRAVRIGGFTLLLFASLPAAAQDGGTVVPGGFRVEPVMDTAGLIPMWVDGQERLLARPVSGGQQRVFCYGADAGQPFVINRLATTAMVEALFTRRGSDVFYVVEGSMSGVQSGVFRVQCGQPEVLLGRFAQQPGLETDTLGAPIGTIDGTQLIYPCPLGICRLDTATLTPSLWVSKDEVRAVVGVSARDGGPDDGNLQLMSLTLMPSGELAFGAVFAQTNQPTRSWMMSRTSSGALRVTWSKGVGGWGNGTYTSAAWSPEQNAVLFAETRGLAGHRHTWPMMGVLSPTQQFAPDVLLPPFPIRPELSPTDTMERIVPGSRGAYGVISVQLHRVRPSPPHQDFDRDGLRATEEASLGTSDFLADSDGDGTSDWWETHETMTDPAVAQGTPPGLTNKTLLAPSLMNQPFGIERQGDPGIFGTWGPMLCNYHSTASGCLQPDGGAVPGLTGNTRRHAPLPLPGQPLTAIYELGNNGDWFSRRLSDGQLKPFSRPPNDHAMGPMPIDDETGVWIDQQSNVWRVSTNGAAFAVLLASRKACPMLSNEAEAASCGLRPELEASDLRFVIPIGFDPTKRMVLFHVTTASSMFIFGVGKTTARRLEDVTTTADGYPIDWLYPMASFGSSGFVALASGTDDIGVGIVNGTFRLDERFQLVPSTQPFVSGLTNLHFYRGLSEPFLEYFLREPEGTGGGCIQAGPVVFCDLAPPVSPSFIPKEIWGELVPVFEPVEPGEIIFWSPRSEIQAYRLQGTRDPHTGLYRDPNVPEWRLWRYTTLAAAVEWLNGTQFTALMSPGDRALLTTTPLGDISSLSASPDGRSLCLVEKTAGRVWVLALDARRVAESVRLAVPSNAKGCAFDETGALAVLEASPVVIAVGATRHPVPGVITPRGLHRLGGRWVVQAAEEPAVCVRDDGTTQTSNVTLVAASAAPGGIAYIDDGELGRLNTVDGFCAKTIFAEAMLKDDVPVWGVVYRGFTNRSTHAKTGVLAVRPDGLALLATDTPTSVVQPPPSVVLALFPEYWVRPPQRGLPEHDDFRREGVDIKGFSQVKLASYYPRDVTAMTTIPGAMKDRDWGYLSRPGLLVQTPPEPTPPPEDPPPKDTPAPTGCGCESGTGVWGWLVLAALRRLRRR